jgi:hypothetical protein
MSMNCSLRHDISLVRGDTFTLFVGLSAGWEDISANPALWEGRLVFRLRQDDALPEIVAVTAVPEPVADPDPRFAGIDFLLNFSMTPVQTESLPAWPVVCFAEIRTLDGSQVRRLFEGNVRKRD